MRSLNGSFPDEELGERIQYIQREGDERVLELQESRNDGRKELTDGGEAGHEAMEVSNVSLIV